MPPKKLRCWTRERNDGTEYVTCTTKNTKQQYMPPKKIKPVFRKPEAPKKLKPKLKAGPFIKMNKELKEDLAKAKAALEKQKQISRNLAEQVGQAERMLAEKSKSQTSLKPVEKKVDDLNSKLRAMIAASKK